MIIMHRHEDLCVVHGHTHYFGHFATFTEGLHSEGMRHVVHGDGVDLNDVIVLTRPRKKYTNHIDVVITTNKPRFVLVLYDSDVCKTGPEHVTQFSVFSCSRLDLQQ